MRSYVLGLALACLAGTMNFAQAKVKVDITCEPLEDNTIDWDCIFGVDSLQEVYKYRSKDKKKKATFTSCKHGKDRPCSRFIVPKSVQRAETKVTFGPEHFPFLENERYVFKYSFRPVESMKLSNRFTHIGQIKGAYHGKKTVDGDPIVSISANDYGLHVRFSNKESIEDFYTEEDWHRNWKDATGEWVHVTITTVFGQSMEVEFAGGVSGKFVWPQHLKPVAWNPEAKMARMKLGLYHKEDKVADGEVEIRDISIEGPNGIIRTSPEVNTGGPTPTPPAPTPPTPPPSKSSGGMDIDITCKPLENNQIDWDCIFGVDSLQEVYKYRGNNGKERADFTHCKEGKDRPCSRFIVPKSVQRAETKVTFGPEHFPFLENERYVFKYSFRAVGDMKLSNRFTHIGQIKGAYHGKKTVDGDPIVSISANDKGLHVRFSNKASIPDYYTDDDWYVDWGDATGEWVDVTITTVFGQSMEVEFTGGVRGRFEWPKHLKPVAWNPEAKMARMKLGLYHKEGKVADADVEIRDISIEGPNGIIRTSPKFQETPAPSPSPPSPSPSKPSPTPTPRAPSPSPSPTPTPTKGGGNETTCAPLKDNQIDWDCVFGPESLEEVNEKGGKMTTCAKTHDYACSRFVVKKKEERSEVKVQEGPEGFDFFKGETYTYKYSFRAKEGMKVGKKFTHLGQLKGSVGKGGGKMIKGDPIYSLTANKDGLMVRFSNLDSIDDYHEGLEKHLDWKESTGQWVHVKIVTTFGESMEVTLSGAVEGKAVWPKHLKPVAWHRDADRVRMKLGLYHKKKEVADGEVEYKNISIEGPNGIVSTVPDGSSKGHLYLGCFEDDEDDRLFGKKYVDAHMTPAMCGDLCEDSKFFGTQYGNECWCSSSSKKNPAKHGTSNKCTTKCPGGGRIVKCGGRFAMDVYEHEREPDDIPKGAKYVGCFRDDIPGRALTLKYTSSTKMDYDACHKFCDEAGAEYYGVEYGKECFCGSKSDKYDEYGPDICSMACTGDADMICGGRRAMNVFSL